MTQPPADFSLTATIREVERHWLARLPAGSLMERAAAALEFERAAEIRDRVEDLKAQWGVGTGEGGGA